MNSDKISNMGGLGDESARGAGESLPPELIGLGALLDRLGDADRGAADDELEHRVLGASLGSLLAVEGTERVVTAAGVAARAEAPEGLEARVHEVSARELRGAEHRPVIAKIDPAGVRGRGVRGRAGPARGNWRRGLAVAACLGLVGMSGLWMMMQRSQQSGKLDTRLASKLSAMSTEDLKASLASDFDILLTAAGESSAVESSESDTGFKAEWLDDLVDEGRAS